MLQCSSQRPLNWALSHTCREGGWRARGDGDAGRGSTCIVAENAVEAWRRRENNVMITDSQFGTFWK